MYPPDGAQYVRHRDALPDSGGEDDQRRVRYVDAHDTLSKPASHQNAERGHPT